MNSCRVSGRSPIAPGPATEYDRQLSHADISYRRDGLYRFGGIEAGLRAGHNVTALVRDPEKAEHVSSRGANAVIGELSQAGVVRGGSGSSAMC